ncbi:acyl-CoA ligase (AMP-forming), exosortase A system-associated [Thalassotalea sp. PP2-459]|uniref:acyl-CoA ligase (AMP-forming), exosortase A system-associated n=1 Tax=Thalassotalea sp. PP2-459 TaxID=1742724 RepID=UPI0009459C37|nr:acyl-CoA ligase (AMP-forming), exosortase A system-associated [Thalassotalea sp. PP2-459]OKY26812.1 acyl-CoA ligase (AMP-forming), exosortase A system-associated [Thalassotalea sp. PP2-459]
MTSFVHELISSSASKYADKTALTCKSTSLTYQQLQHEITTNANGYSALSITRFDRIAVLLPKNITAITTLFACSRIGAVFVPINPLLKTAQVEHILEDCQTTLLVTNKARFHTLKNQLNNLTALRYILLVDEQEIAHETIEHISVISWRYFRENKRTAPISRPIKSTDMAAIFYTSGSTGKPKGVVLSHQNIVIGAHSVSSYLHNNEQDVILAALPISFDYGFSQLTTSFLAGANAILIDYLLPQDLLKAVEQHNVTGLAGVPPLWGQLAKLNWQKYNTTSLRYFTNSGGALPENILSTLRAAVPDALPYMMYGLTEAFRSTYLPPEKIDCKPNSIGKAIPNVEIFVINDQGKECTENEPGELVHTGPLVSLGYWNAQQATQMRFKPSPCSPQGIKLPEIAVYSGDTVTKDKEGYLYFIARNDEMIKTSGYRVSPTEIEEVLYQHANVLECVVIGIEHLMLGQGIIALVSSTQEAQTLQDELLLHCKKTLPTYMIPEAFIVLSELPHNANGKLDRSLLTSTYQSFFSDKVS